MSIRPFRIRRSYRGHVLLQRIFSLYTGLALPDHCLTGYRSVQSGLLSLTAVIAPLLPVWTVELLNGSPFDVLSHPTIHSSID